MPREIDRVVGFHPAPPGWRTVWIDDVTNVGYSPLPGWVVIEEVPANAAGEPLNLDTHDPANRYRRVVATIHDGPFIDPIGDRPNFWHVLGPGEAEPTADEVNAELARRAKTREIRARQQIQDAAAAGSPVPPGGGA